MRKLLLISASAIIVLVVIWAVNFYSNNLRGIGPAIKSPAGDIAEVINTTGMPLTLQAGFGIEIFAKDLPGARVMAFDSLHNMWVSQTGEGIVSLIERDQTTGEVRQHYPIFQNLRKPHGLIFGTGEEQLTLYIAEEHRVSRVAVYSESELEKLFDLPSDGGHFTRTIMWLPGFENQKMLISVGSSCNVCDENDSRRAKILIYDLKTRELKTFASGLRNSVFMTTHPVTGKIWATEMGRDLLGDDIPPDEINIIEEDKDYGWPICYGKNIHDTDFDQNVYIKNPCEKPEKIPSYIDIQAHSAALGLAFVPEEGWPEDYWHNLLVAYHGSWNRSVPTGYKIVRYKLDEEGKYLGVEDFITGWLIEPKRTDPQGGRVINVGEAYGRPVDILVQAFDKLRAVSSSNPPGGVIYISDDKAGVIYLANYQNQ